MSLLFLFSILPPPQNNRKRVILLTRLHSLISLYKQEIKTSLYGKSLGHYLDSVVFLSVIKFFYWTVYNKPTNFALTFFPEGNVHFFGNPPCS